ncbi:MAG: bifunctional (p)ppGpp synthetase/guanosine-3',5'-bis(diphosphate) 3'-pyrophosphohydrolase [Candidatus Nanopelagicales bacterium]|nr:bifunctional (p)ppGpp synthetase/guanosine-3',5'-bis(diphosphate) 3'-pyrophosphohydrolase [Candidatus Nanopelagicales bacterium]
MSKEAPLPTELTPAPPVVAPESQRLRSRIAIFGGQRRQHPELDRLLRTLRKYHPKTDARLVERAYETAAYLHRDQRRRSGDAYITHPVAVAEILADLGMGGTTIAAALLHDTVEDTGYSLDALRDDFGDEVAGLVDGVTKLDKVKYGDASTAETVRKMVIAMARDIRVLMIKLADRLHNMRTLRWMSEDKQQVKARETLEIYAPLAHRLGINAVKWELEDLAFATLYPKMYDEIVHLVGQRSPQRDRYLEEIIGDIEGDLRQSKIKASVTGRPKHYYSVYQKMIVRGRDFADIYDLVGVRILVEDLRDCYAVLGIIHAKWSPIPGRFKDFIAMPKFNMYQSLHTTVIGPGGKPVEMQIRTFDMHNAAEFGVAAHWRYKQGGDSSSKQGPDDFTWLRQLVDWQRETEDPDEFMDQLRYDLGSSEVFVFTPKGDVIALPTGATPVDFAYTVHTEVGHRCVGARVNGKLVPLESKLNNGDVVEIFTSKAEGAGPSRDWISFVASARAKSKIKAWFSHARRDEAIETGKDSIVRAMRKQGLPLQRMMTNQALTSIALDLHLTDVTGLYAAVGENKISAGAVIQRLVEAAGGVDQAADDAAEALTPSRALRRENRSANDVGVLVVGAEDVWVKLAKCCTPVPGDEIVGFVTRGNGVSVHRNDCVNVPSLQEQPDRMVEVSWAPTASSVFLVNIQVEALDRARLLSDVTKALSDTHVNILSASVTTTRDRIAMSRFTFEMADPKHLGSVLRAVRNVEGVFDVYRV